MVRVELEVFVSVCGFRIDRPSFYSSMGFLGCLGGNAVMRQIRLLLRYEPSITNLTLTMSNLLTIDPNGQEN